MTATHRRPYSRLNPATGAIEWVDPTTPRPAAPAKRVRSRLETDDEVRARLRPAHAARNPWAPRETFTSSRGRQLDDLLKLFGLPERQFVDEVQP